MENIEPLVEEAINKDKAGNAEEALQLLETALQYNPHHRTALFYRGAVKAAREDVTGAARDWEDAMEGQPGMVAIFSQKFPEAVERAFHHLTFETTVDPNDPRPHAAFGRACRLFGRYDQALRHLNRAAELDRENWKEGVLCAEIQMTLGQTDSAMAILQKLLESRPDNPEVNYYLGALHLQLNSMAFAIRHLEKAATHAPNDPRVRLLLGEIYLSQGRFDQGETQFQTCLKANPSARVHLGMAECMRGQYRFEEALEQFKLAVEREPQNFRALSDLGALALQFGELQLGVDCLKRALETQPNNVEILGHLAKASQQKGDVWEAVATYRQLLELQPTDTFSALSLANLLRSQGEYAEACLHLRRGLEGRGGADAQVSLDLADALVHLEKSDEAITVLKDAFARFPNHKEVRAALSKLDPTAVPEEPPPSIETAPTFEELVAKARGYLSDGKEDEALQSYRLALALQPKDRECLIETGRLYARKGLLGPAADLLQQGYSLRPAEFDLLDELAVLLVQVDPEERDETLAHMLLAIPADLNRTALIGYWWELRRIPGIAEVVPLIADGLIARFPSDLAFKDFWHVLQSSANPPSVAAVQVAVPTDDWLTDEPAPALPAPTPVPAPPPVQQVPWSKGKPVMVSREQIAVWADQDTNPAADAFRQLALQMKNLGFLAEAVQCMGEALYREPLLGSDWLRQLLLEWARTLQQEGKIPQARIVCASLCQLFNDPQGAVLKAELGDEPAPVAHPPAPVAPAPEPAPPAPLRPDPIAAIAAPEPVAVPAPEPVVAEPAPPAPAPPAPVQAEPETAAPESALPEVESTEPMAEAEPVSAEQPVEPVEEPQPSLAAEPAPSSPEPEALLPPEPIAHPAPEPTPAEPVGGSNGALSAVTSEEPILHEDDGLAESCTTLADCQGALKDHPMHEALCQKTLTLGEGHENELLNLFRALCKDYPDEPTHFRNFARAYLKVGKPLLAVVQYQKYLVACPTPDGYRELAHVYTVLGREKNAGEALKKADELATR